MFKRIGSDRAWEARHVLKAQAGDRRSLDRLLSHYEVALFRHIFRIVRDEEATYDILQETFICVAKSIPKLKSCEKFKAWFYGVATRVALKNRARGQRSPVAYGLDVEAVDENSTAQDLVVHKVQLEALLQEVDTLSMPLRSVILLHYLEEFTLCDTAKALEVPLGTVKSRLAAALKQLRERLRPMSENEAWQWAEREG